MDKEDAAFIFCCRGGAIYVRETTKQRATNRAK